MKRLGVPTERAYSRGDIVRVRLDPVEGSEQAGERPALVVSPEIINRNSPVILVASITTKKVERVYPFEVLIENEGGLRQRSKVSFMHLRSVDRSRIINRYGKVGRATMIAVDSALQIATGFEPL